MEFFSRYQFNLKIINLSSFLSKGTFLFLMFSVSLFACAENNQEIGVPIRPSTSLQPYYMVLAPTGERAYVMYHGKLVQYQLNPLKIISTVDIDLDISPLNKKHPLSVISPKRLFITKDEKRMIIYGHTEMMLFDMGTNKVIKTIPLKKGCAVLNNNEFVTFEKENTVVTLWHAQDLTQKRQFRSSGTDMRTNGTKTYGTFRAHKVGKYIFVHGGSIFRILDSKTYKEIFAFRLFGSPRSFAWIDYDLKTLWLANAGVNPPYSGRKSLHEYLKYHLEDGVIEEASEAHSFRDGYLENIRLYTKSAVQVSPTNRYSSTEGSLIYQDKYRIKSLFQFPDGEAVLWSIKTNHFQVTKNARKHLKMKNANDEIIPMNEATFNKYNKAGISHMEW